LRNYIHWFDENRVSKKKHEKENKIPIFKSFWQWQQFTLKYEILTIKETEICKFFLGYFRIFGDELQLLWLDENKELQLLVEVKEPKVRGLRWYSIGSKATLAHWLINCNAKGERIFSGLNYC
jgi:hypothetical protein